MEQKVFNRVNEREKQLFLFFKRSIDIVGSSIAVLIILAPLVIMLSFFYMFGDNKGPVFFKQERKGQNGKIFYIYKFRSMVVNAESKLKSNPELYKKYIENSYKLEPEEDPRITKLGKFIRETSIDELPQFINVLKGDMSLIGPRPIVLEELREYGNNEEKFLSVKPGLTGYWQVNGRSNVGYPERCDLELYYVENQNMNLDIKIFFSTIKSILIKEGAY